MRRIVTTLLSSVFLTTSSIYAAGDAPDFQQVDNTLAQGYTAVQNQQDAQALTQFSKAGELARKAEDWQGMIDAGFGLATMGNMAEAQPLFFDAANLSQRQHNPAGLIASAYALASLPQESGALSKAEWALDEGMVVVEKIRDPKGAENLAKAYAEFGFADKAAKARQFANQFTQPFQSSSSSSNVTPPPGWSPVGESTKGPKSVPIEVQRLNRESADKDIANKMEYIKHSEQLEQQEKERRTRLAEAYLYYQGYYGNAGGWYGFDNFGMYGFGGNFISIDQRRHWASTQLGYFSPYGGFLVRIDRHRHHDHDWWD